ncbi:helix-turn-helix domain-containing protein [Anaerotruncus massiliensis (ex Liu et al. 2021)]|uniref:helix-turn-helix domain-containing protein n=1 Tax=Anaerotruncus massiliensis (ex Liu et al. 2021) TaxID=2321404 RepID=UPI003AF9DDCB
MTLRIIDVERVKHGLSKNELAKLLGVSRRTLRNWQSGKTEIPVSKLVILSKSWDCSTDYLLGLTDRAS